MGRLWPWGSCREAVQGWAPGLGCGDPSLCAVMVGGQGHAPPPQGHQGPQIVATLAAPSGRRVQTSLPAGEKQPWGCWCWWGLGRACRQVLVSSSSQPDPNSQLCA